MRLQLEVLDGLQKGKKLTLKKGLLIGRKTDGLDFADNEMARQHGVIDFDQKKSWIFECLAPAVARVGSTEQARITLLPGLVFNIGQTALKVIEKSPEAYDTWEQGLTEWLKENPGQQKQSEFFFFLRPVSLAFMQGPQYEQFVTLSYGPRLIGHGCMDIHLKDPSAPQFVGKFFQIGDQCYIENLCGDRVTINSESFDQHPITDGDLLKINSTIIELSFIK